MLKQSSNIELKGDYYTIVSQPCTSKEEAAIIQNFYPMARQLANIYITKNSGLMESEDLVSVATIGLLSAIRKYDPSNSASLATFAYQRMKGSILDEIRSREPVSRTNKKNYIDRLKKRQVLEQILMRSASEEELSEFIGEDDILAKPLTSLVYADAAFSEGTIDSLLGTDETERIHSKNHLVDSLIHAKLRDVLKEEMDTLQEEEKVVLALFYFEELSLKEIAQIQATTYPRINQIHSNGIKRIMTRLRLRMDDESAGYFAKEESA